MPVSLRLLDATAAGTQTLRLLTALVCSVSVTTAVAGPMAYQAIEFRRSHDDVIELSEDKTQIPTRVADQEVVVPDGDGQPANLTRATTPPTIRVTTTAGAATTGAAPGPGPAEPAVSAPGGADATQATPTAGATGNIADGSVAPAAADAGQTASTAGASVATDAAAASTGPASTTDTAGTGSTTDALQEFNPRPACDDRAQELNVGNTPVCTPTSPP